VGSTLHWGTAWDHNGYPLTHQTYTLPNGATFSDDFHTFGLYWSDKELYTYVDSPSNVVLRASKYGQTSFCEQGAAGGFWKPTDYCPWTNEDINAPFNQE
jgi:hypothetical protein